MGEPERTPEPQRPPEPETPAKPPPTSGMAIASLVLGFSGVLFFFVPGFGVLASVLAIIFGAFGISQAGKKTRRGTGMAIAGLILGITGVLVFIAALAAV